MNGDRSLTVFQRSSLYSLGSRVLHPMKTESSLSTGLCPPQQPPLVPTSGEPPPREASMQCDVCSKVFSGPKRRFLMERHVRTHTGEKPYCCPHCHLRFNQSGNLTRHTRLVHQPFVPWGWCSLVSQHTHSQGPLFFSFISTLAFVATIFDIDKMNIVYS